MGAKTVYIMPGSPWENGYCESFNSKLRDEHLNGEIFYTLKDAKIVIEGWQRNYSATHHCDITRLHQRSYRGQQRNPNQLRRPPQR